MVPCGRLTLREETRDHLLRSWASAWQALGLAPPEGVSADDLLAKYGEAGRHYHTAQHLGECLAWLDEVRAALRRPGEVELALWFHDAIYDPRRPDNEPASADWAAAALQQAGAGAQTTERVTELILATCHQRAPDRGDTAYMIDIDLSILGAPSERFDAYQRQVRAEYAFVPEAVYRRKRGDFLQALLRRRSIYTTPHFAERLEAKALENLCRACNALGCGVA
jgi:predicted metal-dependent HD superfamily phosphohydrolase